MANITLTVPDAQVPRIQAALKDYLRLPTDPTAADIKTWMSGELKALVRRYEENQAARTADGGVSDIGVS